MPYFDVKNIKIGHFTEGVFSTQNFVVNVHDSMIRGADVQNNMPNHVKLKPRERDYWHWDKYLTFEFCDSLPKIAALEITPISNVTTISLAGNSTVVDQNLEPYAAWGQLLNYSAKIFPNWQRKSKKTKFR
jgi:hypothetical protein